MQRLISLDVFRGLTIALMILVNSPGNKTPYSILTHASWNGCTLADLVFPFFIIIVGISSVLALIQLKAKGISDRALYQKIIKRSLYIFGIGLILNILPNHFEWSTIRIPGVLQRIAVCYCFSSILFLTTSIRTQGIIFLILMIAYWLLLGLFAVDFPLTQHGNLPGFVDAFLLSSGHLYMPDFDPEGILSTLPALGSVLLGNLIGYYLFTSTASQKQKLQKMLLAGLCLTTAGWLWGFAFPINKALWTSSYVFWTGGLFLLTFALCIAIVERRTWFSFWSWPFLFLGINSMSVYVLHILFLKIQAIIKIQNVAGELVSLRLYLSDLLFGGLSMENAALAYSLFFILFCWLTLYILKWRPNKQVIQKQSA